MPLRTTRNFLGFGIFAVAIAILVFLSFASWENPNPAQTALLELADTAWKAALGAVFGSRVRL